MTFDARTAEPGSRWVTRGRGAATFMDHVPHRGRAAQAEFSLDDDRGLFFACLNGQFWSDGSPHPFDIIAPEPEAKPAVPRRDRSMNLNIDPDWLAKMVEAEDKAGCVSVGGLAVECGLPVRPAEPEPAQGEEVLQHSMNCPQEIPNSDEGCTCGLRWRRDLASRDETIAQLRLECDSLKMAHDDLAAMTSEDSETIKRLEGELAEAKESLDANWVTHQQIIATRNDNARLTADLSAARERVTVLEGEVEELRDEIGEDANQYLAVVAELDRLREAAREVAVNTHLSHKDDAILYINRDDVEALLAALSGSVEDA